jgi:hypothetical protein
MKGSLLSLYTFFVACSIWLVSVHLNCREAYRLRYIEDSESVISYTNWLEYVSVTKGLHFWHPKAYTVTETATDIRVEKPGPEENLVVIRLITNGKRIDCHYGREFDHTHIRAYHLRVCSFRAGTSQWFMSADVTATLPRSYDLCDDWTEIYTGPESIAMSVRSTRIRH